MNYITCLPAIFILKRHLELQTLRPKDEILQTIIKDKADRTMDTLFGEQGNYTNTCALQTQSAIKQD